MSKLNLKLILSFSIVALLIVVAVVAFNASQSNNIVSKPAPKPAQSTSPANPVNLRLTNQFKEITAGDNQYLQFLSNGTLDSVSAEELNLSIWTIDKYIQKAIVNPYFVSGYWSGEDSTDLSSIKSYLSPYFSKRENISLLEEVTEFQSTGTQDSLTSKLFMPDKNLMVPSSCYETWEDAYCFAEPYKITSLTYVGQVDGSITVQVGVTLFPLYQKPNSAEGNLSSQERSYSLSFSMIRANEPTSNDTQIPIMVIDDVNGSLSTNKLKDYLVNEG